MSTVRTQGVTAIYTGLSALVIGTAAKAGVRFLAFDQFRDLLKDSEGKTTGVRSVLGKREREMERTGCGCTQFISTCNPHFININAILRTHLYSGIGSRNDRGTFGGDTNRDYQVICHLPSSQKYSRTDNLHWILTKCKLLLFLHSQDQIDPRRQLGKPAVPWTRSW